MGKEKKTSATEKARLHPRNRHRGQYDFAKLMADSPALAAFVQTNEHGRESIDFFDPTAVKALNRALLKTYYSISEWDIPAGYLCPPIPGRADYIHYVADLLFPNNKPGNHRAFYNEKVSCLDLGVGANCVYPMIGVAEYGWSFVGSDIDETAIANARKIVADNPHLQNKVALRWQKDSAHLLTGIVQEREYFALTICNPPFHASAAAAQSAQARKLNNLKGAKSKAAPRLNFGGRHHELWTEGGEKAFIAQLIRESKTYATSCYWYTTLVSRQVDLPYLQKQLQGVQPTEVKVMEMGQGNKRSRILAWTFLNAKQQKAWAGMLK